MPMSNDARYKTRAKNGLCRKCGGQRDSALKTCSACRAGIRAARNKRLRAAGVSEPTPRVQIAPPAKWPRTLDALRCFDSEAYDFACWLIARQWPGISSCYRMTEREYRAAKRELISESIEYARVVRVRGGDFEAEKADLDASTPERNSAYGSIAAMAIGEGDSYSLALIRRLASGSYFTDE